MRVAFVSGAILLAVVSLVAMSTTTGAFPAEGKAIANGFEPIAVVDPP